MKYYVIEIQTPTEGAESKAIYSYSDKNEALKVFHQKMASGITAGLAGNVTKVLNMIVNEFGNTEEIGLWTAPVEPEPEPEEEG